MPTKRGPIIKKLVKYLDSFPPENIAPWKKPNARVREVVAKAHRGRLERTIREVQQEIYEAYLSRMQRLRQAAQQPPPGGK